MKLNEAKGQLYVFHCISKFKELKEFQLLVFNLGLKG